jgi:hypothetical protein
VKKGGRRRKRIGGRTVAGETEYGLDFAQIDVEAAQMRRATRGDAVKTFALAALAALSLAGPAVAATTKSTPSFTSLDTCALEGRGVAIGNGACLRITGGVSFTESWGNAVGGFGEAPGGRPIVTTPAGTYTIPEPR